MTTLATEGPVTVSITRRAPLSRSSEVLAWLSAGTALVERFPGFLGVGWVRPAEDAEEWHVLYRFSSLEALAGWEDSSERAWWLGSGQDLIEHTRVEKRTGIEGWFDEPTSTDVTVPTMMPPARWKQAVTIWVGFFPVQVLAALTLGHWLSSWNLLLRVLVTTLCITPLMTYLVLPAVTRALAPFLRDRR